MRRPLLSALILAPWLALSGCNPGGLLAPEPKPDPAAPPAPQAAATPTPTAAVPKPTARTAAELNTTTPQQRAEAAKPATVAEVKLGNTIASLGDPTLPGFWIKTPLVKARANGRIHNPATGKSAKVELLPLAGPASGGSQLSLPALQLLGVSLTELPTVEVYRN